MSIYTHHYKSFLGPLPAWALGHRTPSLCLGSALPTMLVMDVTDEGDGLWQGRLNKFVGPILVFKDGKNYILCPK